MRCGEGARDGVLSINPVHHRDKPGGVQPDNLP